jgi:hypothetical protein
LECKSETNRLFSWKTRGQFALDHGKISAMAGLQKPKGSFPEVKTWFLDNVASDNVKMLNEVKRLASLLEVYKGSPFGRVEYLKYISTQFDFKRMLIRYNETSLSTIPWRDLKEMVVFKKEYATSYPYKINTEESLKQFERFTSSLDARVKAERSRKRRLETVFRASSLLPNVIKQCSRCALQGKAGFSRKYKAIEVIDFLNKHGIRDYTHGIFKSKIDSNYCKNQARRTISYNSLPLSVDVFRIISVFTKLDPSFNPSLLLYSVEWIGEQSKGILDQLEVLLQGNTADWAEGYINALKARKNVLGVEVK